MRVFKLKDDDFIELFQSIGRGMSYYLTDSFNQDYETYFADQKIILPAKGKMLAMIIESDTIGVYTMFDRAVIDFHERGIVLTRNGPKYRKIVAKLHINNCDKIMFYDVDFLSVG